MFLNDEPFTEEFKRRVRGMTRGDVHFGLIPKEHWSYPSWINQTKAAEGRAAMAADHVICASQAQSVRLDRIDLVQMVRESCAQANADARR